MGWEEERTGGSPRGRGCASAPSLPLRCSRPPIVDTRKRASVSDSQLPISPCIAQLPHLSALTPHPPPPPPLTLSASPLRPSALPTAPPPLDLLHRLPSPPPPTDPPLPLPVTLPTVVVRGVLERRWIAFLSFPSCICAGWGERRWERRLRCPSCRRWTPPALL